MSKNKELKYRGICPLCNKPYDTREGKYLNGFLYCKDCFNSFNFKTIDNYTK